MIFFESAHSELIRFRINYFILLFLACLFLSLPLLSLGLFMEDHWNSREDTRNLETRYHLLEISMGLTLEKKELFDTIEKQLVHFHNEFSSQKEFSLRELLARTAPLQKQGLAEPAKNQPGLHRSRYELKFLIPLALKMKTLVKDQLPFILGPIWNRLAVYHITPKNWTLLGGVGHVTSLYGNRRNPIEPGTEFHSGIDFAYTEGTPIIATAPGYVIRAVEKVESGYGKYVRIHHGFGFTSLYAHCKELKVKEGDFVERGQVIASIGRTGRTTGDHLHYEIQLGLDKALNPIPFVKLK